MLRSHKLGRFSIAPVLAIALSSIGSAQGPDCAAAAPIAGQGTFAFDNSTATSSGFTGNGNCSGVVLQDVFFQWTAPASGNYAFDTFGTSFDTRLSVHKGAGCTAICQGTNDNAGGTLQSEVQLTGVLGGQNYLIQVGSFYLFSGPGMLNISSTSSACVGLTEDSFEPNQSCGSAASVTGGSYTGLYVNATNSDYFAVTLQPGEWLNAEVTSDSPGDVDLRLFDENCAYMEEDGTALTMQNIEPFARTVYVQAVLDTSSNVNPCAAYELLLDVIPDPCYGLPDDAYENNDVCAGAPAINNGTYTNLSVSKWDKDIFLICLPPQATVTVDLLFQHAQGDIDMFLLPNWSYPCAIGIAGFYFSDSRTLDDNEQIVFTNGTNHTEVLFLEIEIYGGSASSCNDYELVVSGTGSCSMGNRYCSPATVNTSGNFGVISAQGSPIVANNDLTLEAYNLPLGQFGYFLGSMTQEVLVTPGNSMGNFCLSGTSPIVRFNRFGQIGQAVNGDFALDIDLTSFPIPGVGIAPVVAGETWNFQCWYRDLVNNTSVSNFSDAIEIEFQ